MILWEESLAPPEPKESDCFCPETPATQLTGGRTCGWGARWAPSQASARPAWGGEGRLHHRENPCLVVVACLGVFWSVYLTC